jgi:hypothetical protein
MKAYHNNPDLKMFMVAEATLYVVAQTCLLIESIGFRKKQNEPSRH